MYRILTFIFFLFSPLFLLGQTPGQRTLIFLERADMMHGANKDQIAYLRNPTFRHDNARLYCDSAVFYKERNYFEAFGNVHINQADTLNIYSDLLNYDGNKKLAHLEKNVRMVDKNNSTLTTNVLDYNMATRIGTYVNGGKIVTTDVTITSKRGWYFANSRDAFFRYDVLVTNPESTIKSDTLRYNTLSNWAYFYGPTNIKNKKNENLYTESGAYNTKTENAYFGKNNLYTSGSRSLQGDSLYYYGKRGYGKAVKNIVFKDTVDDFTLKGNLGEYFRDTEKILVTRNPYVAMVSDDSVMVDNKKIADTLWLGADTLESQMVLQKNLRLLAKPIIKKDNEVGSEDEKAKQEREKEKAEAKKALTAAGNKEKTTAVAPKSKNRKDAKTLDDKPRDIAHALNADTTAKQKLADTLSKHVPPAIKDTINMQIIKIDKELKSDTGKKAPDKKTNSTQQVLTKAVVKDSLVNAADTIRTRVIKAYHNVKVFKHNLQAKADSLFFAAADSALRWYKNPILWTDSTQQTGDTINVFLKNKKINSFQIIENGFIANQQADTSKFNQIKGKIITGFFADGQMRNLYVDGNAESIYFTKNNKGDIDNQNQTVSSRIKFTFKDKKINQITMVKEIDGAVNPADKLPKESFLTGFIWKPELRPANKDEIIKGKPKKTTKNQPSAKPVVKDNKPKTVKVPDSVPPAAKPKTIVKDIEIKNPIN
ncbi:OstA-like protein [Pedobacter sp.]|uniref:OstA-like protein n=1 Tax=Pedobacter sp. TaxID=1411316 RepID=UPI00396C699E